MPACRNDWIMCVCTFPGADFAVSSREWMSLARGKEKAFSQLEAAGCWGHTYCAGREMESRAMYCSGRECLCGLHRTDSYWSGLHTRPHSIPHASTLFPLEHNGALKKSSHTVAKIRNGERSKFRESIIKSCTETSGANVHGDMVTRIFRRKRTEYNTATFPKTQG